MHRHRHHHHGHLLALPFTSVWWLLTVPVRVTVMIPVILWKASESLRKLFDRAR